MLITWLADVLRAAGVEVVEHSSWKTYYKDGTWEPKFGIAHATAAPESQSDSTQVAIVRNGRVGLTGPIANACVDRDGRWHVLSAGRCNTTLAGTAGPYEGLGNTNALGVEACNDNVDEPWPDVQYDAYVIGWGAICKKLGWDAGHVRGHKEHTPGHKTDPTLNMSQFRSDVTAAMRGDYVAFSDEQKQDIQSAAEAALTRVLAEAGLAAEDGNQTGVTARGRTVRNNFWMLINKSATAATTAAMNTVLTAVLANVTADDNEKAQILADAQAKFDQIMEGVASVDEEVLAKISNPATPDQQVAAALRQLLENRPGVLALLKQD